MEKISYIGGSMVGWVNASWPLAKLTISSEHIFLSTFGKYEFTPEQVISIEPYGPIPLLASGIRINHNRQDYPRQVVFWCMGGRKKVLASFEKIGFLPQGIASQRPSGIAFRWSVILAFLVIWNALFLFGMSSHNGPHDGLGPFELIALISVFVFSTAAQKSVALQNLILRDGHHIGEIKQFLRLLQLVTGMLFLGFSIAYFLGRYGAALDNETSTKPIVKLSTCGKPAYPKSSLAANETGTVTMSLHVSKEGRVLETRVEKSSGYSLLDASAVSALSQCEFTPARENDVVVDSRFKMQYVWRIE